MPPNLYPAKIKITRTPLAGGGTTVVEENLTNPAQRILDCSVAGTQSIGQLEATLSVDNTGGFFDAWSSGDVLRIEGARPQDASYTLLCEGFIGEMLYLPGSRPRIQIPVHGASTVLDLVNLTADATFDTTAWTTIFDTLCSTYLVGYTRTITADAAACTTVTFPLGMKLREALDIVRRALIATTGNKWEFTVAKNAATSTITLFKRDTTVQKTVAADDLLQGSQRWKGNAYMVANRVKVQGAVVPSITRDHTGDTKAGTVTLDSTAKWVAQPFQCEDTPLYAFTTYADRSSGLNPPTLAGRVARNSDNYDRVFRSVRRRPDVNGTFLRIATGTATNLDDRDTATKVTWTPGTAQTNKEFVVWDLGASPPAVYAIVTDMANSIAGSTWQLWWSDNDSAYTSVASGLGGNGWHPAEVTGGPLTHRYWKLTLTTGGTGGSVDILEAGLLQYGNLATDPGTVDNRYAIMNDLDGAATTTIATTGATTKEVYRTDFVTPQAVAMLDYTHTESIASSLFYYRVQVSDDGSTWMDQAILSSTTGVVTDTIYLEIGDHRYLRILAQDDRAAASASATFGSRAMHVYFHVNTWGSSYTPLSGDDLLGSDVSWGVSNLVSHPGIMEEQTYPSPRLALTLNRYYWFVLIPQSGASATQFWLLDYATGTPVADALKSTDTGATWSSVAANALLKHRIKFNNHQLTSQVEDAASQATYANMVPSGILYASLTDSSLVTQDMVDNEALALLTTRKTAQDRIQLVLQFDPSVVVGKRVTLKPDNQTMLGTSGDYDVVEFLHNLTGAATTTLLLNEHAPVSLDAHTLVAGAATGRTA